MDLLACLSWQISNLILILRTLMMTAAFHRPLAFSISGDPIHYVMNFVANEICAGWFWCLFPALPNLLLPSTVTPAEQTTQKPLLNSIITHINHVFHGEIIHSLCMWAAMSTHSSVSVTFFKNPKHLVDNLFPQQQTEATLYSSHPGGCDEQRANGSKKLHEKGNL